MKSRVWIVVFLGALILLFAVLIKFAQPYLMGLFDNLFSLQ